MLKKVVPGSHRANYMLPPTLSVHPTTGEGGPLPDCNFSGQLHNLPLLFGPML